MALAVAGASGRMGRCVLELACRDPRFQIAAALTRSDDSRAGVSCAIGEVEVVLLKDLRAPCDVLIDFTVGDGTLVWLETCVARRIPMVIGATGHDEPALVQIREASRTIPVVKDANYSTGIHALLAMLGPLVRKLGDGYDIEIVETHHRHKLDAPSGTALLLLDEILRANGRTRDGHVLFGRSGRSEERAKGQIGVHAVRMGEIVGRHEIHLSGPGETLTLIHAAQSREAFAAGALRAAQWVVGRSPGLYSMRDVLGPRD